MKSRSGKITGFFIAIGHKAQKCERFPLDFSTKREHNVRVSNMEDGR